MDVDLSQGTSAMLTRGTSENFLALAVNPAGNALYASDVTSRWIEKSELRGPVWSPPAQFRNFGPDGFAHAVVFGPSTELLVADSLGESRLELLDVTSGGVTPLSPEQTSGPVRG